MYCEFQEGDLCRKHAINAILGNNFVSNKIFYKSCDIFDLYCKQPINTSKKWFYGNDDWNIINWIIF